MPPTCYSACTVPPACYSVRTTPWCACTTGRCGDTTVRALYHPRATVHTVPPKGQSACQRRRHGDGRAAPLPCHNARLPCRSARAAPLPRHSGRAAAAPRALRRKAARESFCTHFSSLCHSAHFSTDGPRCVHCAAPARSAMSARSARASRAERRWRSRHFGQGALMKLRMRTARVQRRGILKRVRRDRHVRVAGITHPAHAPAPGPHNTLCGSAGTILAADAPAHTTFERLLLCIPVCILVSMWLIVHCGIQVSAHRRALMLQRSSRR